MLFQTTSSIIDVVFAREGQGSYVFLAISVVNLFISCASVMLLLQSARVDEFDIGILGDKRNDDVDVEMNQSSFSRRSDMDFDHDGGITEVQSVAITEATANNCGVVPIAVSSILSVNPLGTASEDVEIDERGILFNTRMQYADKTVDILKKQLSKYGANPLEYIPLEQLKVELQELMDCANRGIPYDEARLDYLLTCMDYNPEFIVQQEAEQLQWREEISEYCADCLEITKGFVSPQIFHSTVSAMTDGDGYSANLAKRLIAKKCLWLVRVTQSDIERMHIAELQGRFNPQAQGLDIVETAAIYSALPIVFSKDIKKEAWRKTVESQLKQMYKELKSKKLVGAKLRHPVYKNQVPKYEDRLSMHELNSISSESAFKPRTSFQNLKLTTSESDRRIQDDLAFVRNAMHVTPDSDASKTPRNSLRVAEMQERVAEVVTSTLNRRAEQNNTKK